MTSRKNFFFSAASAVAALGLVVVAVAPVGAATDKGKSPLAQAIANTEAAQNYRLNLQMGAKGLPLLSLFGGSTKLLDAAGQVNGDETSLTARGMLFSFIGGDANTGVSVYSSGDQTWVKGMLPALGINASDWEMTDAAPLPKNPISKLFNSANPNAMRDSDFRKLGKESVDGLSCDVFYGDQAAFDKAFKLAGAADLARSARLDVNSGTVRMWACSDGLIHKVTFDTNVIARAQGNLKLDLNTTIRAFDFGSAS